MPWRIAIRLAPPPSRPGRSITISVSKSTTMLLVPCMTPCDYAKPSAQMQHWSCCICHVVRTHTSGLQFTFPTCLSAAPAAMRYLMMIMNIKRSPAAQTNLQHAERHHILSMHAAIKAQHYQNNNYASAKQLSQNMMFASPSIIPCSISTSGSSAAAYSRGHVGVLAINLDGWC